MNRAFAPFLICALAATAGLAQTACAQPAAPPGPAAEVREDAAREALDAWLAAFNANSREQLEAFQARYPHRMDIDGLLAFHAQTGGFRLLRHEPAPAGQASALLQEAGSETVARLEVTLDGPDGFQTGLQQVPRPDDLRIARGTQGEALDVLVRHVDAEAAKDAFSGVFLVAQGNDILLQRAWGLADRAKGTPVTLDTRFRLGSANKMITAVATLQLVHAGKISLDGRVGDYLPGYPNPEIAGVTVRQLLTHAGGTGDIFGPEFDARRLELKTHADFVALYGKRGPVHPPGQDHQYSNYGFLLLGAIIEKASGQSYYDYVQQHIHEPAGMRDTGSLPEDVRVERRAVAYTRRDGAWVDAASTLPYRGTSAGGGYSTAGDMLRFARALQSGKLLPPALLAQATQAQSPWYGFGFMVGEEDGVAGYGHGGGAEGMSFELRVYPSLDRVVIGMSNLDPPVVQRLLPYYLLRMPMR